MSIKNHSITLISTLVMSFAAGVQADAGPSAQACPLDKLGAVAANAFENEQEVGYVRYSPQNGAQLFVPAKEGLTAEWITLSFQRALSMESGVSSKCRPNVRDVKVQVVSAGPGFNVFLSAPDQQSAKTLVSWARALVAKQTASMAVN